MYFSTPSKFDASPVWKLTIAETLKVEILKDFFYREEAEGL